MTPIRQRLRSTPQILITALLVMSTLYCNVVAFGRKPVRVGVVTTGDAGDSATATSEILSNSSDFACTTVPAIDLRDWQTCGQYDVLIFPGGSFRKQAEELGEAGRANVRRFVAEGGGYLGICAGAYLALGGQENALGIIRARPLELGSHYIDGWGRVSGEFRGGLVDVALTQAGEQTFGDAPRLLAMAYAGGPIFLLDTVIQSLEACSNPPVVLARYCKVPAGFEFQDQMMLGTPAIITGKYGKGTVVVMSPHPDFVTGSEQVLIGAVCHVARR